MTRSATLTVILSALVSLSAAAAPPHANAIRLPQATPPPLTPGTACQDVPHLAYPASGGTALIQHVKVIDVFYSPGHKYKSMLESFYKAILVSPYMDWLSEYNINGYTINHGSFLMSFEDTNPNPATVQTVNPETYLKGLLAANKLPAPDDDTFYMIYFPSGVDPNDGSGGSCISNGDFCAYHSSYQGTNGKNVRYGVMPDMEAGKCTSGCGPQGFDSFTDVSSHELIEAITDSENAWYDDGADPNAPNSTNCGEIGDICAVGGTMEGATVAGYFVQNEWSNKNKKCISVDPNAVLNDFTLTVSPTEISVPAGGSADVTVTLAKAAGVAENIALTAPTPPTGLTASFAPASATSAGGTSTVTVSAGPSLTAGTALMLTVKGAGSTASHSATVNVNVIAALPPDMATGTGGNGGSGGSGGGSGNHGGGGCSVAGTHAATGFAVGWPVAALLLLALAFRRRRAV